LAFSGHKMYAPFGAGVLIGDRAILETRPPDDLGGGTVDFVTPVGFDLTGDFFRRENPGTPNAVGLLAMALAASALKETIGFDAIVSHEQDLLSAARPRFPEVNGLCVLEPLEYSAERKCAILSFVMEGVDHGLLAARLSYEFGIGVRHGHLCQFAYVARLLGLSAAEVDATRRAVLSGKREAMYGVVRASFGLGNRVGDVLRIAGGLQEIAATPERSGWYERNASGDWAPRDRSRLGAEEPAIERVFEF
jgi:selenocysteine lyase/cysteine desulfurase